MCAVINRIYVAVATSTYIASCVLNMHMPEVEEAIS